MEIEFDHVTYILRKKTPLEYKLLDDVSFKIESNSIVGFLGKSGEGKSAIPKLISLLIKPNKGKIKVYNQDLNKIKKKDINKFRSSIGYVFENPSDMFLTNNVLDEISFAMKYFKYKPKDKKKRIKDSLKIVGLTEEYLSKSLDELSLNEKRKVSLASVLVYNPKIILLDEPTLAISMKDKKELIRIIRMLKNKYGKTIIVFTKDTDFLYRINSYNYIMDNGSIVAYGNDELLKNKELLDTYDLYYPSSLEFVTLANEKSNSKLEVYKEVGELIKGVYRDVF